LVILKRWNGITTSWCAQFQKIAGLKTCSISVSFRQENAKWWNIQGVSRLVEVTAGDFLGFCDQKFHINMCPILDGYGVMTA